MDDDQASYDSEAEREWEKKFEKQQAIYHSKYLAISDSFEPDEDDKIAFKDDKKWQRLIFPSYEGYSDYEDEKYNEFTEHLKNEEINVPKWVTKRMLLRVLEGEDFKLKQAATQFVEHLIWREENLPIELNDHMTDLIVNLGMFYTHGRDRSLRPIAIFQPIVVVGRDIVLEESILACHHVAQHVIEKLMVVGKIENWVNILDLHKLGLSSLPKNWIIAFIKSFSQNLYARTKIMFLLNCGTAVSMMWGILKVFVHWTVKKKMIFNKKHTDPVLQEM